MRSLDELRSSPERKFQKALREADELLSKHLGPMHSARIELRNLMTTIENDNSPYGALVEYRDEVYVVDRTGISPRLFHVVSPKDKVGTWVTEDMIKRI